MTLSQNGQKAYEAALRMHAKTDLGLNSRPKPEDFAGITDAEDALVEQTTSLGSAVEDAPLTGAAKATFDRMLEDTRVSQGQHFDVRGSKTSPAPEPGQPLWPGHQPSAD